MCYTCGCKRPFDDHGDPRNLTEKDLQEATRTDSAGGADISKVKRNVEELIELERSAGDLGRPKDSYAKK